MLGCCDIKPPSLQRCKTLMRNQPKVDYRECHNTTQSVLRHREPPEQECASVKGVTTPSLIGSFWPGSKKVRRREEDPPDNRGGSEQTEPMGFKPFSFRDAVMNSNPLNNPLNNKREDDNIDLMDGKKIGYNALSNKVCSLWKPSMRFQLMDIENDYFLAKSESFVDYRSLYKRSILQVIDEMVGNVIKIDLMTDKGARGQFARFAVQIDLRKSLVSRIKIASRIHRVEYESLPMVCFGCGTFGHLKGDCPQSKIVENMEKRLGEAEDPIRLDQHENTGSIQERIENEKFGEWMFVDHWNCRQNQRTDDGQESGKGNNLFRPRFNILSKISVSKDDKNENGASIFNFGKQKEQIVNLPVELSGEGQEKLSESITKIMNRRKFDRGQVNKQAVGGPRMKNQGGGIEKIGMSSETLKIGPNVGSG
ncbi:hypothetical protein Gogos_005929, partial [Gossypium gossypioides]|nr:hypothetical protein [Gossypium gossypioides]